VLLLPACGRSLLGYSGDYAARRLSAWKNGNNRTKWQVKALLGVAVCIACGIPICAEAEEVHSNGKAGNGDVLDDNMGSSIGAPHLRDRIQIANLPGTAGDDVIDESDPTFCRLQGMSYPDVKFELPGTNQDDGHAVNTGSVSDTPEDTPSPPVTPEATTSVETQVKQAIERSLPYLKKEAGTWISNRGCVSCHRVSYMIWAHSEAQARGFDIDREHLDATTNLALVNMLTETKEYGGADTISQMLLGRDRRSAWRAKPPKHFKTVDPYERLFEILLDRQKEDGSWPPEGQLRTPPELTTGWALLALASRDINDNDPGEALDPAKDLGDELAQQLANIEKKIPDSRRQARTYLEKVEPHPTHESLVLRAMLAAVNQDESAAALRQRVMDAQNPDGGWSNRLGEPNSDAYATGQTLFALARIGGQLDPDVVGKAHHYLTQSQRDDGAWHVSTNFVRSGDRSDSLDEVYSYWGTAWGTIGLLETLSVYADTW
jgi:Squalene-hopene cyclase C-terminal domain